MRIMRPDRRFIPIGKRTARERFWGWWQLLTQKPTVCAGIVLPTAGEPVRGASYFVWGEPGQNKKPT